eukprot:2006710-Prymnesium_polylepis.1
MRGWRKDWDGSFATALPHLIPGVLLVGQQHHPTKPRRWSAADCRRRPSAPVEGGGEGKRVGLRAPGRCCWRSEGPGWAGGAGRTKKKCEDVHVARIEDLDLPPSPTHHRKAFSYLYPWTREEGGDPRPGVNKALHVFMNNEFEYGVFRLFKLMIRAGADYSYS